MKVGVRSRQALLNTVISITLDVWRLPVRYVRVLHTVEYCRRAYNTLENTTRYTTIRISRKLHMCYE